MPDTFELVSSPVTASLRSLEIGESLAWAKRFPVDQIFDRSDIADWKEKLRNRTNNTIQRAKGQGRNYTFESVQGLNTAGDAIIVSLVVTRVQ